MSSRREKEKRLRPRSSPYKRNHFDQTKYLHLPVSESNTTNSQDFIDDDLFGEVEEDL
jgi:hypothetical protein